MFHVAPPLGKQPAAGFIAAGKQVVCVQPYQASAVATGEFVALKRLGALGAEAKGALCFPCPLTVLPIWCRQSLHMALGHLDINSSRLMKNETHNLTHVHR